MSATGSTEITRFTILDEQGPGDILLFGCGTCGPDKKLTSHQLEQHAKDRHGAPKFTVGTGQRPARSQGRKPASASTGSRSGH